MRETEAEIADLQTVMDRSFATAGPQLAGIAGPEKRLNARQVVAHLRGMKHIAVATVSSVGHPLVGPFDSFFLHGRFWMTTGARAYRAKHLARNAAVSAVYFEGEEVAVTVHGSAAVFRKGAPEIEEILAIMTEWYKGSPFDWGDIVFIRIDPERMLTYAREPGQYSEG